MSDLQKAEEELAEKEAELAQAQAKYDAAMREKQVIFLLQMKCLKNLTVSILLRICNLMIFLFYYD